MQPEWYQYFSELCMSLFSSCDLMLKYNPELANSPTHTQLYEYATTSLNFIHTQVTTGKADYEAYVRFYDEQVLKYPLAERYLTNLSEMSEADIPAKKKKGPVPIKREKKVVVPEKKEFDDTVRKEDVEINLPELIAQDKYKNIEDFRRENCNLVFIGHVDHGKSTLCGRILTELDQVDEQ